MKILIIEDEKLLADSLKTLLEKKGFAVECVYDGEVGAEYAETGVYDLLILDVNLPDGSGLELLDTVRETSRVPVILLTANDMEMDRMDDLYQQAVQSGWIS